MENIQTKTFTPTKGNNCDDKHKPQKSDPVSLTKGKNLPEDTTHASARVQFSIGTKERDGGLKGVKRVKRSFRDIVLTDVIGADSFQGRRSKSGASMSASPQSKRSILKMRGSDSDDKQSLCFVNQAYVEDDVTIPISNDVIEDASEKPSAVAVTDGSAFPYAQRKSSDTLFAGVVELIFRRGSTDFGKRDTHPFGRDCTVDAILQGKEPPKPQNRSAKSFSKLFMWLTLLSFLLGAAVGVIFLSEKYNAKLREERLLEESQNTTSTS